MAGKLSTRDAAALRRRLWRMLELGEAALTLDCSRTERMDGAAVAVLLEFAAECRRHGTRLSLLQPSGRVWDAFSLYGLRDLLLDLGEFDRAELDGVLVILEPDFPDSIRLPAVRDAA
jgi:anti-anti-sigma factor